MNKILIIGGCGYIGSRVYLHLKKKNYVDTMDLEWYGNNINSNNIKKDYGKITKSFLSTYSVVILLAGHSSVAMCQKKRFESFKNNVQNFIHLLDKITDQKLIYASSSSVYGNTKERFVNELYDRYAPINNYDLSKKIIDYYSHLSTIKYYGLRFGTVNGWSPNLRLDLVINKMYDNAVRTGVIHIYNAHSYRPILGINDACRVIDRIIENDIEKGIYNIASFNTTIEKIAKKVAKAIGNIKVIDEGIRKGYNFSTDTSKFIKMANFTYEDTIENIVDSLKTRRNTLKTTRN